MVREAVPTDTAVRWRDDLMVRAGPSCAVGTGCREGRGGGRQGSSYYILSLCIECCESCGFLDLFHHFGLLSPLVGCVVVGIRCINCCESMRTDFDVSTFSELLGFTESYIYVFMYSFLRYLFLRSPAFIEFASK